MFPQRLLYYNRFSAALSLEAAALGAWRVRRHRGASALALILISAVLALPSPRLFADDEQDDGRIISQNLNDWPMSNQNSQGTRYNKAETLLSRQSVPRLRPEWIFPTLGNVNATPAVVDHTIYAGDTSGTFYALDDRGRFLWSTKVNGPITDSALVTNKAVIFGDLKGFVYGLDRETGAFLWSIRPNPSPFAAVYGSPTVAGRHVVVGIASNQEFAAPGRLTSTDRGSVVSLDPETGAIQWQVYTISDAEQGKGAAGAGVWSTPTYDPATSIVYVTTGNNFTAPATDTSDAFLALDGNTGAYIWKHQLLSNDVFNGQETSSPPGPDADFGDSPQIYTLPGGRKVVGAGQKSGVFYVLDAATGVVIGHRQVIPFSVPAVGLFADSAVAEGVVFANGLDAATNTGHIIALNADSSAELWRFTSPGNAPVSGVAVANGVVYFETVNNLSSVLYALDAHTGGILATVPIKAAISGPSISHGHVYVGTGATYPGVIQTLGGNILSLGLKAEDQVPFTGLGTGTLVESHLTPSGLFFTGIGTGILSPFGNVKRFGQQVVNQNLTFTAEERLTAADGEVFTDSIGQFDITETQYPRHAVGLFTVMGGTGKFLNAVGIGTFEKTANADGTFTDIVNGVISRPSR